MSKSLEPPKKKWRQTPVSCLHCRQKKLKCDRANPCGNCVSRGVPCQSQEAADTAPAMQSASVLNPNEVIARLDRLERFVFQGSAVNLQSTASQLPNTHIAQSLNPPITHTSQNSISSSVPDGALPEAPILTFHIQHLRRQRSTSLDHVVLPPKDIAIALFEIYVDQIAYLQHVIYLRTARSHLEAIYAALSEGKQPVWSHVSLLLAIWATVAMHDTTLQRWKLNEAEALNMGKTWLASSIHVLHCTRVFTTNLAIEDVQARVLVVFLLFALENLSPRTWGEHVLAISTARQLGLHKVDLARNTQDHGDNVQKEIRRRLWWHLASTDWLTWMVIDSQVGTYTVIPQHMAVNMPRNINDEDLDHPDSNFTRPEDEPTIMSYFIQRIRIAELCRAVREKMPFSKDAPSTMPYHEVLALDARFQMFLDDLPVWLKVDADSLRRSTDIHRRFPFFAVQRYIIHMNCLSRRSELHQPFMIRGLQDKRFKYSRDKCLESIRMAFKIKETFDNDPMPLVPGHAKNGGILHAMFVTVMILSMDLCAMQTNNETDEAEWQERRVEVMRAIEYLEKAKKGSPIAKDFVRKLEDVLEKHKIRRGDADRPLPAHGGSATQPSATNTTGTATGPTINPPSSILTPISTEYEFADQNMNSDDLWWQKYVDTTANFDMQDWDELFTDLNTVSTSAWS